MSNLPNVPNPTNAAKATIGKVKEGAAAMKNFANELMGDGNCYLVVVYLVCIIFLVIFSYSLYLRKELTKSEDNLKKMEEITAGRINLLPLTSSDYYLKNEEYDNTYYALLDYYVMGSYNSCCSGPIINGHVSTDALDNVIKHGVRFLDFEIYLKDNKAVVAAGRNNIYIKDTLNELNLGEVLEFVKDKALNGSVENNTDPLLLQFRIMSGNDTIYSILAHSIKTHFKQFLAPAIYGKGGDVVKKSKDEKSTSNYSGNGKTKFKNNILHADLNMLKNKVIIIVKDHPDFKGQYKKNKDLYELVNIGNSNNDTVIWRTDYDINNSSNAATVKEENKYSYCITNPDPFNSKENSKASTHILLGCQAILMNFGAGFNDTQMKFYKRKFAEAQRAFLLKPKNLRRARLFIGAPKKLDERMGVVQERVVVDYGGDTPMDLGYWPGGGNIPNT
jgi:hypothetical protein